MGDKNWRHVLGGRWDDTCDHVLSRRSLRVKTSYELSWKVKVMLKNKYLKNIGFCCGFLIFLKALCCLQGSILSHGKQIIREIQCYPRMDVKHEIVVAIVPVVAGSQLKMGIYARILKTPMKTNEGNPKKDIYAHTSPTPRRFTRTAYPRLFLRDDRSARRQEESSIIKHRHWCCCFGVTKKLRAALLCAVCSPTGAVHPWSLLSPRMWQ